MKKMMRIVFTLLLICALSLSAGILPAFAETYTDSDVKITSDQKTVCNATLDDDFADDTVLVAMKQDVSLAFKTYTPADFPEIKLTSVDEITKETTQKIKAEYDAYWKEAEQTVKKSYSGSDESYIAEYATKQAMQYIKDEHPNYRQILVLTLADKSKENVLNSIKELEKRDDIQFADPNYITYIDDSTIETTKAPVAEAGNQPSTADSAVKNKDTSSTSPKTGYNDYTVAAVMVMMMTVAGIAVSVAALRRRRSDTK